MLGTAFVASAVCLLLFTPSTRFLCRFSSWALQEHVSVVTNWRSHTGSKICLAVFATIVSVGAAVLAIPQFVRGRNEATPAHASPEQRPAPLVRTNHRALHCSPWPGGIRYRSTT